MAIWAIADLHLSLVADKPMDIFGDQWEGHADKIERAWRASVTDEDTVLLAGDISWGMTFEEALPDLQWIDRLPGTKVLIRGNHDYWWKAINKLRTMVPPSLRLLQNDSMCIEGRTVCGCRGWTLPIAGSDSYEEDKKIFERERIRLELSLKSAKDRTDTIVMMHYPPMLRNHPGPDFTDILESWGVNTVVYGHMHGDDGRNAFTGTRNGVHYLFTACDGIEFAPVRV